MMHNQESIKDVLLIMHYEESAVKDVRFRLLYERSAIKNALLRKNTCYKERAFYDALCRKC